MTGNSIAAVAVIRSCGCAEVHEYHGLSPVHFPVYTGEQGMNRLGVHRMWETGARMFNESIIASYCRTRDRPEEP
jgi:hypothetical protein